MAVFRFRHQPRHRAGLGWPCPPLLLDVRNNDAFVESTCMLPGALHRDPFAVEHWGWPLRGASPVVVYCVHGHEVSIITALTLRQMGIDARYLEGGIEGWRAQGLPVLAAGAMAGWCRGWS